MNREERKELRITELECIAEALKSEMYAIDDEIEDFCVAKDKEHDKVQKAWEAVWRKLDKINPPSETDQFVFELPAMDLFGGLL